MHIDNSNAIKAEVIDFMLENFPKPDMTVVDRLFDKEILEPGFLQKKIVDDIGIEDFELTGELEAYAVANNTQGLSKIGRVYKFTKKVIASEEEVQGLPQITDFFKNKAIKLMDAMARTRQKVLASAFNKGSLAAGYDYFDGGNLHFNDTTGEKVYDSKPFFNLSGNTRSDAQGNTYYNHIGASSLTVANLKTAISLMESTNAYNYLGEPVEITASRLLVPTALKATAYEITATEQFAGTTTANLGFGKNFLYQYVEPIVWRYLTDADGWFLLGDRNGIKELVKPSMIENGTDFYMPEIAIRYDLDIGAYVMTAKMWVGYLVTQWQYYVAANTATS